MLDYFVVWECCLLSGFVFVSDAVCFGITCDSLVVLLMLMLRVVVCALLIFDVTLVLYLWLMVWFAIWRVRFVFVWCCCVCYASVGLLFGCCARVALFVMVYCFRLFACWFVCVFIVIVLMFYSNFNGLLFCCLFACFECFVRFGGYLLWCCLFVFLFVLVLMFAGFGLCLLKLFRFLVLFWLFIASFFVLLLISLIGVAGLVYMFGICLGLYLGLIGCVLVLVCGFSCCLFI